MPVDIRLDFSGLNRAIEDALEDTVADYADQVHDAFSDARWDWAGLTKRRSGAIVGSPRDVVDTGALRDSMDVQKVNAFEHEVSWSAPYAAAVFLGAVFKTRAYTMPGRNVPEDTLNRMDFEATFNAHLGRHLQ